VQDDFEMAEFAREEIGELEGQQAELEALLKTLLLPKDAVGGACCGALDVCGGGGGGGVGRTGLWHTAHRPAESCSPCCLGRAFDSTAQIDIKTGERDGVTPHPPHTPSTQMDDKIIMPEALNPYLTLEALDPKPYTLHPKQMDDKNIMLEVRAGTGGDEAGIWAGDLYRMYLKWVLRCCGCC
jgi:hypothetical protein